MAESAKPEDSQRLGGFKAEFVASLGRKTRELRRALGHATAGVEGGRDDLKRRLHALGASAKTLGFAAVVEAVEGAESLAANFSHGDAAVADAIARALDDLPALAWTEPAAKFTAAPRDSFADSQQPERPRTQTGPIATHAALVVGEEALAKALSLPGFPREPVFAVQRVTQVAAAMVALSGLPPDLLLVDAALPESLEVVEKLFDDPGLHAPPIVVVDAKGGARLSKFVALGVTKALEAPLSPEAMRAACIEAIDAHVGKTTRVTFGEPTVEQLGDRLADEVRRAIVDAVPSAARGIRVSLGEGGEIVGALWGAIARVREIVTARTAGAVRFDGRTVEVPPPAFSGGATGGAERRAGRGRGAATDVELSGTTILVVDDDPAVTWFLADLLRAHGCRVHEAFDGREALDMAARVQPDVVLSDVVMPKLDGFGLARALRRDPVLADVPVVFLSWRDDLLQRVHELGAYAAASLRKDEGARTVIARVREALWARARTELRLRTSGDVSGRLDGLTTRSLLGLVCSHRGNARVSIQDANFSYEVEIRGHAPKRAVRSAPDGSLETGTGVLASLLGVRAGRFLVAPSDGAIEAEFDGDLDSVMAPLVAAARGAILAVAGSSVAEVDRIDLDRQALDSYAAVLPTAARDIVERLAAGGSPRKMLSGGGDVDPVLLEQMLVDLASRGIVLGVTGANGEDRLGPSVQRWLDASDGAEGVTSAPSPASALLGPDAMRAKDDAEFDVLPDDFGVADDEIMDDDSPFAKGPLFYSPPAVVSSPLPASPASLGSVVLREVSAPSPSPPGAVVFDVAATSLPFGLDRKRDAYLAEGDVSAESPSKKRRWFGFLGLSIVL